jgi:hypothetical protein
VLTVIRAPDTINESLGPRRATNRPEMRKNRPSIAASGIVSSPARSVL